MHSQPAIFDIFCSISLTFKKLLGELKKKKNVG